MPVTISATDNRLRWEGAVSVEYGAGWVQPWRLPVRDLALYPHLLDRAARPSSVRLRFATDAVDVAFITEPLDGRHTLDLYAGNKLLDQCLFKPGADRFVFSDLPPGWNVLELWLPPSCPFRLRAVVLSDGASLEEAPDTSPRWVTYGSSITQCAGAGSGATTWPAFVARTMGLHLTSFGFGGQCHMDPMMARLIRSQPADVISLKLGINICGQWSLNKRTFLPAALGTMPLTES